MQLKNHRPFGGCLVHFLRRVRYDLRFVSQARLFPITLINNHSIAGTMNGRCPIDSFENANHRQPNSVVGVPNGIRGDLRCGLSYAPKTTLTPNSNAPRRLIRTPNTAASNHNTCVQKQGIPAVPGATSDGVIIMTETTSTAI